ncbi:hypothetical protein BS47DRAFT_1344277 [Hydnum rufescens UP504]|uniref:Uncharacterized protein n=1 Tax=Hydnum rufescens UP504 TaxID=1448309 RepID=A0A9P6AX91_9AGAM|nr:hypothetical protein BS47DRAFT_1344277 [Hydnum rufescens UP504]
MPLCSCQFLRWRHPVPPDTSASPYTVDSTNPDSRMSSETAIVSEPSHPPSVSQDSALRPTTDTCLT